MFLCKYKTKYLIPAVDIYLLSTNVCCLAKSAKLKLQLSYLWNSEYDVYLANLDGGPASLVAQRLKRLPAKRETWVWSLGWEDSLEKEMATHSSILAWRIPLRSLVVYSPQGRKELGTTEWLHFQTEIKKQKYHFADKGPYSQSYGFSSSHVQVWE